MANMTTTFGAGYAAAPRTPFASLLGGRLAAFIARRREASRIRREVEILQALDDRMLTDIGLNRTEIESVVRHGRYY